jgi:asparagine synthase (glutamine-hydrolysing)
MGTQFGHWDFGGTEGSRPFPGRTRGVFVGDAAQGAHIVSSAGMALAYDGLTALRIGQSTEPSSAAVLLWDGRLDNGPDLLRELGRTLPQESSEAEIVAASFERWQTNSFQKLIGDWSLTIWNSVAQSLILAKDTVGLRPLFYTATPAGWKWSSSLPLLVEDASGPLDLDEEYLAGWLSFFPAAHLSPFRTIRTVPPSSFVRLERNRASVHQYWDFDPGKQIRYTSPFDYEEHFRAAFATAVRRRLRSDRPLLAELSGGMDSSSIVCVSDALLGHERGLTPRLDTLSFYDDSEPNWNERPYFARVEEKRGRIGHRIKVDPADDLAALIADDGFTAAPGESGRNSARSREVANLVGANNYAAILSGTGGDEFMGGVPTAIPELADLLVGFQIAALCRRVKTWALSQRRPWLQLAWETARSFAPNVLRSGPSTHCPPAWLVPQFMRKHRAALTGYDQRLKFFGPRPSFQENVSTFQALRRQIACSTVSSDSGCERRYPYLDRDLLEFLFAIPREQLIEPGRRRSLMRRALAGIVPDEILARKRKAFVNRGPRVAIASQWARLIPLADEMIAESLGLIASARFLNALEEVRLGKEVPLVPVLRTLVLERWLRNLTEQEIIRPAAREQIGPSRRGALGRSRSTSPERVSAG